MAAGTHHRRTSPAAHIDSPASAITLSLIVLISFLVWVTLSTPEHVKDTVTALALLVGGGWTLYQFGMRKSFESCLSVDITVTSASHGPLYAVDIDTILRNIGNRRIVAPPRLTDEEFASYEESVEYPCDLQLRQVPDDINGFVGWWYARESLMKIPDVPDHVSLLYEYTRSDEAVDFFMEPNEVYHLGALFVLPAGHYVAKVVFVGSRGSAAEFWSRITSFHVPSKESN